MSEIPIELLARVLQPSKAALKKLQEAYARLEAESAPDKHPKKAVVLSS